MYKLFIRLILLLLLAAGPVSAQGIREPVWSGQFYPADAQQLSALIEAWLEGEGQSFPGQKPAVLIAPHAGYIYSGRVAAFSYRQVKGKDYDAVVVISPSHHHGFRGGSIYMKGGYRSPFGVLPVDAELAEKISQWTGYSYIPEAHAEEHAIEVQVPFIQKSLPHAKICPIVLGAADRREISNLTGALKNAAGEKDILVVASTDMSHYLSQEDARKRDKKTIEHIRKWEVSNLIRMLENRENIMCGGAGVAAVLDYAQSLENCRIQILKYDDSTTGGGPESRVVGYLSAAVWCGACGEPGLAGEDQRELFQIARSALNRYVRENQVLIPACRNPKLLSPRGAFVTLHKNGRLRGCVGFVEGNRPLYTTVAEAAILASARDARFKPVEREELDEIVLEISILTPPVKIDDPELIQVGRHGLIITQNGNRGLLLPQVAVENKWSRETLLARTCIKAGLPRRAWKDGAEMYIFEAQVFHEEE
jgi:MEMO1 family protein